MSTALSSPNTKTLKFRPPPLHMEYDVFLVFELKTLKFRTPALHMEYDGLLSSNDFPQIFTLDT